MTIDPFNAILAIVIILFVGVTIILVVKLADWWRNRHHPDD